MRYFACEIILLNSLKKECKMTNLHIWGRLFLGLTYIQSVTIETSLEQDEKERNQINGTDEQSSGTETNEQQGPDECERSCDTSTILGIPVLLLVWSDMSGNIGKSQLRRIPRMFWWLTTSHITVLRKSNKGQFYKNSILYIW